MATDPPPSNDMTELKLEWPTHFPTWKVGDEMIGLMAHPSFLVQTPIFFGPLSKYKGVRRNKTDSSKYQHLSDNEYVFNHRVVQHDGKPHFGGYFNAANHNLYKLMIDSINSSSDASVNGLINSGEFASMELEEDEGYMWLLIGERRITVPLNFDTSGHILPVLFTAIYQKEKGTPIADFIITASDLPINPLETENKRLGAFYFKLDKKLLLLIIKKNPPNTPPHDFAKNALEYLRLKELGIDYQLVTYEDRNRLKDIDPSDPDDAAAIRAEVAAAKKAK